MPQALRSWLQVVAKMNDVYKGQAMQKIFYYKKYGALLRSAAFLLEYYEKARRGAMKVKLSYRKLIDG